jgi:hypothetical protein
MTNSLSALMRPLAALALVATAGCAMVDPYARPGIWRPMGSNEMNFELQVARAADLVKGRGVDDDADGNTAAAAVDRLQRDKVKPLPSTGISSVGQSGATGSSGGS